MLLSTFLFYSIFLMNFLCANSYYSKNLNWNVKIQSNKITTATPDYSIIRINNFCLFMSTSSNPFDARKRANSTPPPPMNQFIRANTIRVIGLDETGEDEMLGIMSLNEALALAEKQGVDLVMINDKTDPPICRVIDYGKFKYIQDKKKKENLKKQVKAEIKEVKMSYKIDQHDIEVRQRAIQKFVGDGDRVKIVVQFKGREMQHKELGVDLLMKLFNPLNDVATIESPPKIEGRSMAMLVGPKKVNAGSS